MPYISYEGKKRMFRKAIAPLGKDLENKGDLACLVAMAMDLYMSTREFRYDPLSECCSTVSLTADDFKRRFLYKREDQAIEMNGDVYTFDKKKRS